MPSFRPSRATAQPRPAPSPARSSVGGKLTSTQDSGVKWMNVGVAAMRADIIAPNGF